MHPNQIIFRIKLAQRDYSFNGLVCKKLNVVSMGTPNATFIIQQQHLMNNNNINHHLKELIYSRKWMHVEFDECHGIEGLLLSQPQERLEDEERLQHDSEQATGAPTTQIDYLSIRFSSRSDDIPSSLSEEQQEGEELSTRRSNCYFLSQLWTRWKVTKCKLSILFTPGWIKDFTDNSLPTCVSYLEELDLSNSVFQDCAIMVGVSRNTNDDEDHDYTDENNDHDDGDGGNYNENNNNNNHWLDICHALVYNHPRMHTLKLNNCNLSDQQLACLIDHSISCHPMINKVDLKGNTCQEQSLLGLARAFTPSSNTTTTSSSSLSRRLSVLSITNKELSEDTVAGLKEFCQALQYAHSLTYLSLGEYMIYDMDMKALVSSLSSSNVCTPSPSKIETLSLLTCGMTAQSIRCLCEEGLQQNKIPNLRALSIPEDAADALAITLEHNTSLEKLLMEGRTDIHTYYLDLNRGGRRLFQLVDRTENENRSSTNNSQEKDGDDWDICQTKHYNDDVVTVPASLWPQVLSRAMHQKSGKFYYGGRDRDLDVLYCLLRNRILLEM
jgi:hypothetical protein